MPKLLHPLFIFFLLLGTLLRANEFAEPGIQTLFQENRLNVTVTPVPGSTIPEETLDVTVTGLTPSSIFFPDTVERDGNDIYDAPFSIQLEFARNAPASLILTLTYQICDADMQCSKIRETTRSLAYPGNVPERSEQLAASDAKTPPGSAEKAGHIATLFTSKNLPLILGSFFGFGFLLALTPCMLPMIPILSAVIVCKRDQLNTKKAFLFSLVYVLSMATVYALAGVAAAYFGSTIQIFFQSPWVIGTFALLFVLLGFAMFDLYALQMPRRLQSILAKHSACKERHTLAGIALLGILSALIVGPCVAPPMVGALIYISQTSDILLGASALFAMGLGLGVPLLILGIGAGRFMPKPGPWMENVKLFFGFFMFGFAVWLLSRILDANHIVYLWALLLITLSVFMGLFDHHPRHPGHFQKLKTLMAVLVFLYGLIALVGALGGAKRLSAPLEPFTAQHGSVHSPGEGFKTISSTGYLELVGNIHRPTLFLFYAQWCDNCKAMEHDTLETPEVRRALKAFECYRIDMTENSDADLALLKRYRLFGPPGILFFDASGRELEHYRVVGALAKTEFLEKLSEVEKAMEK